MLVGLTIVKADIFNVSIGPIFNDVFNIFIFIYVDGSRL